MNHHTSLHGYGTGLVWVLIVGALNWVVVAVRMLATGTSSSHLVTGARIGDLQTALAGTKGAVVTRAGALDVFSLLGGGNAVFWIQLVTYVAIGVVAVFVAVFWACDLLCEACHCLPHHAPPKKKPHGNPNKKHAHQLRLLRSDGDDQSV
jgi:hypothetical protein